jgi:hypothetical protein
MLPLRLTDLTQVSTESSCSCPILDLSLLIEPKTAEVVEHLFICYTARSEVVEHFVRLLHRHEPAGSFSSYQSVIFSF